MKENRSIQSKVDEALQSLDGLKRATPGPFFYTRVEARLNREQYSTWELITSFVTKPAVALSVVCLVLLLNATVIFKQAANAPSSNDQSEISLADEYTLASSTIYDYENQEP